MPWTPLEPGDLPTLGYEVIDWISAYLLAPDRAQAEPFILYPEQARFVLRFYELDPETGERLVRRGVFSRSRGHGKSPFLAAICCAEALGPVVPDGWDSNGQPVGKPWVEVRTPLVQVAAVAETQTKNTWGPLLEMLDGPAIDAYPGLEPLDTFVNLPRGRIEPITSSARTTKGNRAVFAVLDQTEEWVASNGGLRLAETMRINAGKIGGTTIESPNAYIPGEGSVAEASAEYWKAILEGRALEPGLLYDHREAPPDTDLTDPKSLRAGLLYAYGDSAKERGGHFDIDRAVSEVRDLNADPQRSRADWLNQITHASDAWVTQPEWAARADLDKVISDGDELALGFDGSRGRKTGIADSTALYAVRISDGHCFELAIWEQPPNVSSWDVPTAEVDAAVHSAFARYPNIRAFFGDPALWESWMAQWEARYAPRLTVKASREHPMFWWTNRPTVMEAALESFHSAIVNGEMTHDGSFTLTRHMLNARRRKQQGHIVIGKETKDSAKKMDAAMALTLAWTARLQVLAKGSGPQTFVPRRIR